MLSFTKISAGVMGIAAFTAVASALSISSQCEGALAGLLTDSGAACLNPSGIASILTTSSSTSLVGPVDSWLQGVCNQAACTNDTLAAVANDVVSGCQAELQSAGLANITAAQLTGLAQQFYPSLREMACLQDSSNNTLCPTEFLTNLQTVTGPLTTSGLQTFLGEVVASSVPPLPASLQCTDCSKQWYNIIKQAFPGVADSSAESNVQNLCGANFTDGQTPSDVKSFGAAGNTTADTKNSGAMHLSAGIGASALVVLSSAFAILA
ncbi:hypothetical protein PsYK624_084030 [Phanerochaete sordida]|uniref:Uncharacterized protein n=1 Tax=Phanerochaete sordida TaxID=48140 RepID=A0A9P3GEF2_9APHY|nr:hypothetical protein PsYK624_084030 [Phanerochaete sordida]